MEGIWVPGDFVKFKLPLNEREINVYVLRNIIMLDFFVLEQNYD